MKKRRFADLEVWCAGGDDGDGSGDGPAIVLCHGFGAPGNDLASLWRAIDAGRGVRWFFPEAPLSLQALFGAPARAWWMIDMQKLDQAIRTGRRDELAETTPEGMEEARGALEACLETMERDAGWVRERSLIGGFSQGAMITTELAVHATTRPFAGLIVWSGTLLCRERWRAAVKLTGPGLHVAMSHGRRDPLLPFSLAEELRDLLTSHGASVDFVAHGGAHEIPASALEAAGRLALARLR